MMTAADFRDIADRIYAERKEYSRHTEVHHVLTDLSMLLHTMGAILSKMEDERRRADERGDKSARGGR